MTKLHGFSKQNVQSPLIKTYQEERRHGVPPHSLVVISCVTFFTL